MIYFLTIYSVQVTCGQFYSKDSISISFPPPTRCQSEFFFRGVLLPFSRLAPLQTRINIREKEVKLWVNQMQCVAIRTYYTLQQKKLSKAVSFCFRPVRRNVFILENDGLKKTFSFQFLLL